MEPWSLEGLQASGRRFALLDEEQDSDPDPNYSVKLDPDRNKITSWIRIREIDADLQP